MGLSRALWLAAWASSAGCFYSWDERGGGGGSSETATTSTGGAPGATGGSPGSGGGEPSSSTSGGAPPCETNDACGEAYCLRGCEEAGTCVDRSETCATVKAPGNAVCDCAQNVIPSACFAESRPAGVTSCVEGALGDPVFCGDDCTFDGSPRHCLALLDGDKLELTCSPFTCEGNPDDPDFVCASACWTLPGSIQDPSTQCGCFLHNGVAIVNCVL